MIRRHCVLAIGSSWVLMRISPQAWDMKKLNGRRRKYIRYRGFRYPEIGVGPS